MIATLEQTPPHATHWSRTSMAQRSGLSKSTMREYLVLRYLAERAGTVVSRRELTTAIWNGEGESSNTLTTHILRLRRRLEGNKTKPQWIQAIRGIGYQFTVPAAPGTSSSTPK